ncbi:recombination mediator RecR [Patescibacteria group bacterium]
MNSIDKLTEIFKSFPGIGSRQAKRFVYFLLSQNPVFIDDLSKLIADVKKDISQCANCYRFFTKSVSSAKENNLCAICANPQTDKSVLMVVEKDVDLENVNKTGAYKGLYFILGGSLPILEQNPAKKIRARELFDRAQEYSKNGLKEVILATSATPEGENTAQYVKKILAPLAEKYGVKISALGRGLSTGTELEYSDASTLENALKNRG